MMPSKEKTLELRPKGEQILYTYSYTDQPEMKKSYKSNQIKFPNMWYRIQFSANYTKLSMSKFSYFRTSS